MTITLRPPEKAAPPPTRRRRAPAASDRRLPSAVLSVVGLVLIVVVWAVAGSTTRFIAPIGEVLGGMPEFLEDPVTWATIIETWIRVLVSLAAGFVVGTAVAVLIWKTDLAGRVASVWVTVLLSVPSTISAMIAVFLFADKQLGAIVVLTATVFPFIAVLMLNAFRRLDPGLTEMAVTYRLSAPRRVVSVIGPQVFPTVMTALRNEHAHTWKVVVVVELFLVSSGMGFQFDKSFDRFDMQAVMQWLIVFATILLLTEYLILRPLENKARAWRGTS